METNSLYHFQLIMQLTSLSFHFVFTLGLMTLQVSFNCDKKKISMSRLR